jgi:hypothetical protein
VTRATPALGRTEAAASNAAEAENFPRRGNADSQKAGIRRSIH